MSKSMTAVFLPWFARPVAKLALVVVLPTPPLPEVTTMTLATRWVPLAQRRKRSNSSEHEAFASFCVERQRDAYSAIAELGEIGGLQGPVNTRHCDQLRVEEGRKNAGVFVSTRTRQRPAAQRNKSIDAAIGDQLGAPAGRRQHDDVAPLGIEALTGAHRLRDVQRRRRSGRSGRSRDDGVRRLAAVMGSCAGVLGGVAPAVPSLAPAVGSNSPAVRSNAGGLRVSCSR